MPSHRSCTERLQLACLGKPHDKVHKAIDYPYKFLGPKHRILFHDPITAVIVARTASKEKGAGLAAVLHIATDWLFHFTEVQNSSRQLDRAAKTVPFLMILNG